MHFFIHLEVSYEDYINNDYNYFGLSNDTGFIKEVTDYNGYKNFKYATIINNINNNYVSINANFAPKTIEVEGTTYYLYETYITDQNGVSNISIPNDGNDYYLKEIIAPKGYNLDTRLHKIDMTEDELDIDVYNSETTKEESENGDQKGEQDEYPEKNPETGDDFFKVIIVCLITLELFCIIETKKNRV